MDTWNRYDRFTDGNCLRKAQEYTHQTNEHRNDSGPTEGKPRARIPIINIVPPATENKMLQDENNSPGAKPISYQREEASERFIEVGRSRNGDKDVNHGSNERPDSTIDALESFAKYLHG